MSKPSPLQAERKRRFNTAAANGEFDRYKDLGGYRYHRDDLDQWRRQRGRSLKSV